MTSLRAELRGRTTVNPTVTLALVAATSVLAGLAIAHGFGHASSGRTVAFGSGLTTLGAGDWTLVVVSTGLDPGNALPAESS